MNQDLLDLRQSFLDRFATYVVLGDDELLLFKGPHATVAIRSCPPVNDKDRPTLQVVTAETLNNFWERNAEREAKVNLLIEGVLRFDPTRES